MSAAMLSIGRVSPGSGLEPGEEEFALKEEFFGRVGAEFEGEFFAAHGFATPFFEVDFLDLGQFGGVETSLRHGPGSGPQSI